MLEAIPERDLSSESSKLIDQIVLTPKLPKGVNFETIRFLEVVIEHGIHKTMEPRNRALILWYFDSEASLDDLKRFTGVNNRGSVSYRIIKGMNKMHAALPTELQELYPKDKVIKLKDRRGNQNPEVRRKMSEAHKGITFSSERKKNMSAGAQKVNIRITLK